MPIIGSEKSKKYECHKMLDSDSTIDPNFPYHISRLCDYASYISNIFPLVTNSELVLSPFLLEQTYSPNHSISFLIDTVKLQSPKL